jgi:hypothetical protein
LISGGGVALVPWLIAIGLAVIGVAALARGSVRLKADATNRVM